MYANPPTNQDFYPNGQQNFQLEDIKPKTEQLGMDSIPPASSEPAPQQAQGAMLQDEDAKSDTSYDPLFDDAPDGDGEPDSETASLTASSSQPPPPIPQFGMGYPQNPPHAQRTPQPQPRSVSGAIAPKNAPPILDPQTYTAYSPDVLMVASIDGQIVLWDRRVHTPGTGVGRLWMSEKTPPWCVSVSVQFVLLIAYTTKFFPAGLLVSGRTTDICGSSKRHYRNIRCSANGSCVNGNAKNSEDLEKPHQFGRCIMRCSISRWTSPCMVGLMLVHRC